MILDQIGEALTANPILTVILIAVIVVVLAGYLFFRRILVSAREGYESGQRRR